MQFSFFRQLSPAGMQLLLALICFTAFGAVALQVAYGGPIVALDTIQAERVYRFTKAHSAVYEFALWITDINSGRSRIVLIAGVAVILVVNRQKKLALCWVTSQWFLNDVVGFTKNQFERPRPNFPETPTLSAGWSFPSGHAMGAMATYAMLAYLVARRQPQRPYRWPLIGVLATLVLAIGTSRILLGVHWFSDVLGGYLLALGYVGIWIAAMEVIQPETVDLSEPEG